MNIATTRASRALAIGKTGSGKSTLALEMVDVLPRPVLIVDTKWSDSIGKAARVKGWEIVSVIPRRLEGVTVWRPEADQLSDPYSMDAELDALVRNRAICSIYIDELYQLHSAGRAGPGIVGLWTRGREMGFTVLASTQRPAWVSQFCLTESDQYYIFTLTLKDDRKKLAECLGNPEISDKMLDKHWFFYVKQGEEAILCQPLKIRHKRLTEETQSVTTEQNIPKLIL